MSVFYENEEKYPLGESRYLPVFILNILQGIQQSILPGRASIRIKTSIFTYNSKL